MLAKDKLNIVEVLISRNLIVSDISHDVFVSVNNDLQVKSQYKILILLIPTINMLQIIKTILISEKEFTDTNYERLKKHWVT